MTHRTRGSTVFMIQLYYSERIQIRVKQRQRQVMSGRVPNVRRPSASGMQHWTDTSVWVDMQIIATKGTYVSISMQSFYWGKIGWTHWPRGWTPSPASLSLLQSWTDYHVAQSSSPLITWLVFLLARLHSESSHQHKPSSSMWRATMNNKDTPITTKIKRLRVHFPGTRDKDQANSLLHRTIHANTFHRKKNCIFIESA